MIDSHELKGRDSYLNKLIGFQDTEPVKVITGIRRCGKSSLLKLMVQHLKDTGILSEQIIEMNFESFDFHGFEVRETQSALGGFRRQVFDKNGERYELREVFDAYMRFGGMPGIADVGLEQEKALSLLEGIYSTVVIRDILEREKRRGQKQIADSTLLRKIILFLADNIGSSVSISSIGNTLVNEGLLDDGKRKGTPSVHTVQAYVNALLKSYFFYEIKRFDIKGKSYLRTLGKYYIVDIGLRNYLLGFRNRDSGHTIGNVVYFELLRRGLMFPMTVLNRKALSIGC